jgi:hypothetical protein
VTRKKSYEDVQKDADLLRRIKLAFDTGVILRYKDPEATGQNKIVKVVIEEVPENLDFSVLLAKADNRALLYNARTPHETLLGLPSLPKAEPVSAPSVTA